MTLSLPCCSWSWKKIQYFLSKLQRSTMHKSWNSRGYDEEAKLHWLGLSLDKFRPFPFSLLSILFWVTCKTLMNSSFGSQNWGRNSCEGWEERRGKNVNGGNEERNALSMPFKFWPNMPFFSHIPKIGRYSRYLK